MKDSEARLVRGRSLRASSTRTYQGDIGQERERSKRVSMPVSSGERGCASACRWLLDIQLTTVLVLATACGSDIAPSPTPLPSPSPTPVRLVTVEVLVVGVGGSCIVGATVEVTAGQSVGKSMTLTDMCDVWGDTAGEAQFSNLTPDVPMTLRASATGYLAQEMTVVPPTSVAGLAGRVVFALSRSPSP